MIFTSIGRDITPTNYGYATHVLVEVHPQVRFGNLTGQWPVANDFSTGRSIGGTWKRNHDCHVCKANYKMETI